MIFELARTQYLQPAFPKFFIDTWKWLNDCYNWMKRFVNIYIYIHRERQREREKERDLSRETDNER